MSELQKESWGWLGEHVHASAPQSPKLQLPRSTTSPSHGVIAVAAAGAAARFFRVAVRAAGGAAAAGARPPGRAGQLRPRVRCPPTIRRDGLGRGEAASALAHDSVGRRALWVKERELEQELEEQDEEKPSENPLCAAARRPRDITWSAPPRHSLPGSGARPSDQSRSRITSSGLRKGGGSGGTGRRGGVTRDGSDPYRE